MTDIELLQKELDEQKWLASKEVGEDMSGGMGYCRFCNQRYTPYNVCSITHESRVGGNLCAIAYKEMNATNKKQSRKKK